MLLTILIEDEQRKDGLELEPVVPRVAEQKGTVCRDRRQRSRHNPEEHAIDYFPRFPVEKQHINRLRATRIEPEKRIPSAQI